MAPKTMQKYVGIIDGRVSDIEKDWQAQTLKKKKTLTLCCSDFKTLLTNQLLSSLERLLLYLKCRDLLPLLETLKATTLQMMLEILQKCLLKTCTKQFVLPKINTELGKSKSGLQTNLLNSTSFHLHRLVNSSKQLRLLRLEPLRRFLPA